MSQTRQPIPVPWANRFRYWFTRHLPACLFVVCVVAVGFLWFDRSPRIVLRGQVEMVHVVVTASRDGMLEMTETAPDKLDRVEQGVSSIARFDLSDALLSMESLTAERERLRAELEAERLRLQRDSLALRWEIGRQERQVEQFALDQLRLQAADRDRIDGLRSDLIDLEQSSRQWQIKQQETAADVRRLDLEIAALESTRPQVEQLIERRLAAPLRLAELDTELELKREMRQQAKQLAETLVQHDAELDQQSASARQRLASADGGRQRHASEIAETDLDLMQFTDAERAVAPFAQAIAVQDAKIRVLAHQIATHDMLAPASGQIVEVHKRPGTFVRSGDPIATIASGQPRWIVAYLDQPQNLERTSDTRVEIRVDGDPSSVFVSNVAHFGDHYEQLPTVLRDRREIVQWGVPIKVPVPASMHAIPGQTVQLVIR